MLYFLPLLLLTPHIVLAAVSNMNTPTGPFIPDSIMTINWIQDASTGDNPKEVQLELINKNTGDVRPIDKHVDPNRGSYNWHIPSNLSKGNYYIRMSGGSGPLFTGDFSINAGSSSGSDTSSSKDKSGSSSPPSSSSSEPSSSEGGSEAKTASSGSSGTTPAPTPYILPVALAMVSMYMASH